MSFIPTPDEQRTGRELFQLCAAHSPLGVQVLLSSGISQETLSALWVASDITRHGGPLNENDMAVLIRLLGWAQIEADTPGLPGIRPHWMQPGPLPFIPGLKSAMGDASARCVLPPRSEALTRQYVDEFMRMNIGADGFAPASECLMLFSGYGYQPKQLLRLWELAKFPSSPTHGMHLAEFMIARQFIDRIGAGRLDLANFDAHGLPTQFYVEIQQSLKGVDTTNQSVKNAAQQPIIASPPDYKPRPTGQVSLSEALPPQTIDRIWKLADEDGDGKLTFTQWQRALDLLQVLIRGESLPQANGASAQPVGQLGAVAGAVPQAQNAQASVPQNVVAQANQQQQAALTQAFLEARRHETSMAIISNIAPVRRAW